MGLLGDPTPRYKREQIPPGMRGQIVFDVEQSLADTEAIVDTDDGSGPMFPRPRMAYDDEGMATEGSDPAVALGIVLLIALVLGAVGLVFILMHVGGHAAPPCPVPGVPA